MKKLSFLVFGLALMSSPFFYGCEEVPEDAVVDAAQLTDEPSERYRPCIIREVCIPEILPGRRAWFNPSLCLPGNPYQCSFYTGRKRCFPLIVDCFWRWDPWWRDPWEWREFIDPGDIYDFRRDLEDVINPKEDFGTFPINEHLLGMQYFRDVPGLIDKEVFRVHTSIELDKETVASIGLKGNVIPAGTYPVLFNEKSETFNAIVSVDSYPIIKKKRIAVGKFEEINLTKFLAEPQLELVETSTIVETGKGIGLVGYTPHPDDPYPPYPWPWPWPWPGPWPFPWITVFTPNDLSVGIQFYNPDFQEVKLEKELKLNEELAKVIGVEPFELTNENLEYQFDKELGITTVLIHQPQAY